jgi:hypothetical protein
MGRCARRLFASVSVGVGRGKGRVYCTWHTRIDGFPGGGLASVVL